MYFTISDIATAKTGTRHVKRNVTAAGSYVNNTSIIYFLTVSPSQIKKELVFVGGAKCNIFVAQFVLFNILISAGCSEQVVFEKRLQ